MQFVKLLVRKIKHAVKSVFYNRAQYLCFFVAMFVVEIFCGLVVLAAHNGNRIEYRYITGEFDHHLALRNMNEEQYYYMHNDTYTVFADQHIYDVVRTEERSDAASGEKYYTMYIKFARDPKSCYEEFQRRYYSGLNNFAGELSKFSADLTPLFDADKRVADNAPANLLAFLLVTVLSVGLLTSLYNIRINHYRFEYGIYMAFGADFRRLMSVCVWEMLVVAVVVFVPAVVASWLISLAIFSFAGEPFGYYFWTPVITLVFALVTALLSVCMGLAAVEGRRARTYSRGHSNLVTRAPLCVRDAARPTADRASALRFRNTC